MKDTRGPGKETFPHLHSLFAFADTDPAVRRLERTFLSQFREIQTKRGMADRLDQIRPLYEEAAMFLEEKASCTEYPDELLLLQRNLYQELEAVIVRKKPDTRHHFFVVIPVAERPLMLKTCVHSLLTQCRTFGYGGVRKGRDNAFFYRKISLFIIDDSRKISSIRKIKEIAAEANASGLRTFYVGLDEQSGMLKRIPVSLRDKLSRILGGGGSVAMPHKGPSVMRNMANLYLRQVIQKDRSLPVVPNARTKGQSASFCGGRKKVLLYFLDSDEEFRIRVRRRGSIDEISFINYFYWLDRLFECSDIEVLTGKVVGDPPVSPAVMVNTFLDDLHNFFRNLAARKGDGGCIFHETMKASRSSADYHDMVTLFGYRSPAVPKEYQCRLQGNHSMKDTLIDFSSRALGFFHGLHPTREQLYSHRYWMETEEARTVYTGNYVFNEDGLVHFLPFADMRLRMAGPVLGRILRRRLGRRFISANLPLLHKRTFSDRHSNEFRAGILRKKDFVDLSQEFFRQFWGDVMLFSVEELSKTGYPARICEVDEIREVVLRSQTRLWQRYRRQKAEMDRKIGRTRTYLSGSKYWWNKHSDAQNAIRNLGLFCSIAEENFGSHSESFKALSAQIREGMYTENIIYALRAYYEDFRLWNELLRSGVPGHAVPTKP